MKQKLSMQESFDKTLSNCSDFYLLDSREERMRKNPVQTLLLAFFRRIYYFLIKIKIIPAQIHPKTFWGDRLYMPPRVAFPIILNGFYEGGNLINTMVFLKMLSPGDVVIDGGAHFGWYTAIASRIVGPEGSVHSFEPTPRNFKLLKQNADFLGNVVANEKALWSKSERVTFNDFGESLDVSNTIISDKKRIAYSKVLFDKNKKWKKISVEAVSLDDYCKEYNIRPRFVKLDIEGAEGEVIVGAPNIMKDIRPIFLIETWKEGHAIDSKTEEIMDLFASYDYSPYLVDVDSQTFRPYASVKKTSAFIVDVVFIPNEEKL